MIKSVTLAIFVIAVTALVATANAHKDCAGLTCTDCISPFGSDGCYWNITTSSCEITPEGNSTEVYLNGTDVFTMWGQCPEAQCTLGLLSTSFLVCHPLGKVAFGVNVIALLVFIGANYVSNKLESFIASRSANQTVPMSTSGAITPSCTKCGVQITTDEASAEPNVRHCDYCHAFSKLEQEPFTPKASLLVISLVLWSLFGYIPPYVQLGASIFTLLMCLVSLVVGGRARTALRKLRLATSQGSWNTPAVYEFPQEWANVVKFKGFQRFLANRLQPEGEKILWAHEYNNGVRFNNLGMMMPFLIVGFPASMLGIISPILLVSMDSVGRGAGAAIIILFCMIAICTNGWLYLRTKTCYVVTDKRVIEVNRTYFNNVIGGHLYAREIESVKFQALPDESANLTSHDAGVLGQGEAYFIPKWMTQEINTQERGVTAPIVFPLHVCGVVKNILMQEPYRLVQTNFEPSKFPAAVKYFPAFLLTLVAGGTAIILGVSLFFLIRQGLWPVAIFATLFTLGFSLGFKDYYFMMKRLTTAITVKLGAQPV